MTRTLKQIIEEWEQKNMVVLGTVANVKSGRTTSPLMARQIAKAFGAQDEEADAIAAQYASQRAESKDSA